MRNGRHTSYSQMEICLCLVKPHRRNLKDSITAHQARNDCLTATERCRRYS